MIRPEPAAQKEVSRAGADLPVPVQTALAEPAGYPISARRQQPAPGSWDATWLRETTEIAFDGRRLSLQFCYVGTLQLLGRYDRAPAWVIDPRLPVGAGIGFAARGDAHSYSDMSPEARNEFLTWLSQGRPISAPHARWVQLFLEGVEVRICSGREELPLSERIELYAELERVRCAAGEDFRASAACARMQLYLLATDVEMPEPTDGWPGLHWAEEGKLPLPLRIRIGRYICRDAAIPPELALQWLVQLRPTLQRTPAKRCPAYFERVFCELYRLEFPEGVPINMPTRRIEVDYLDHDGAKLQQKRATRIPDPALLTAPLDRIAAVADAAQQQLAAFSQLVARAGWAVETSLEGQLALPQLVRSVEFQNALAALAKEVGASIVVTSVAQLLPRLGAKGPTRLSRSQWQRLEEALGSVGIGIEWRQLDAPSSTASADELLALLPLDDSDANTGRHDTPPPSVVRGTSFAQAACVVELAAMALSAGTEPTQLPPENPQALPAPLQQACERLGGILQNDGTLQPVERARLLARLRLRYGHRTSMASVRRSIADLDTTAKGRVAKQLVATLAGIGNSASIDALRKLWRALEQPEQALFSGLHESDLQIAPDRPGPSAPGMAVAPTRRATKTDPPVNQLDWHRIAELSAETSEAHALLAGVFVEDGTDVGPVELSRQSLPTPHASGTETAIPASAAELSSAAEPLPGLDPSHCALVRFLLSADRHPRSSVAAAAEAVGLMTDGALERINEAAFEHWGAPLHEGEDPIEVSPEALAAVQSVACMEGGSTP